MTACGHHVTACGHHMTACGHPPAEAPAHWGWWPLKHERTGLRASKTCVQCGAPFTGPRAGGGFVACSGNSHVGLGLAGLRAPH
jgi:hypothetical protein